jgi:hypothetical protein
MGTKGVEFDYKKGQLWPYGQPRVRYPGLQGGGSTTKLSGIMEVAMLGFDHVSLTRMWVDYSVI